MGNSPQIFNAEAEKKKLEINCLKIKGYLELYRDRKMNDARYKELTLIKNITSPSRFRQDEIEKSKVIITGYNYCKACDILIRYSEIVRNNSINIIENRKDYQKIIDLIPFIESIVWSVKYMGIDNLIEFQEYMLYIFGNEFLESIEKSLRIDPDLKVCFENLIPTPLEINNYFIDLSTRTGLSLEKINEVGHEFCRSGSSPPKGPSPGDFNYLAFQNNNGSEPFNGPSNGGSNDLNANYYGGNAFVNNNIGFGNVAPHQNNSNYVNEKKDNGSLPALDDFEERMKKLKG